MVWDLVNLEIDSLHSPDNWNKLKVFFQIQLPNFKAWWPKFFPWEVNVSENLLPLVLIMLAPGAHGAEPSIQGLCVYCGHVWVLLPFLPPFRLLSLKGYELSFAIIIIIIIIIISILLYFSCYFIFYWNLIDIWYDVIVRCTTYLVWYLNTILKWSPG